MSSAPADISADTLDDIPATAPAGIPAVTDDLPTVAPAFPRRVLAALAPAGVYLAVRLVGIVVLGLMAGGDKLTKALNAWDGTWMVAIARYGYGGIPERLPILPAEGGGRSARDATIQTARRAMQEVRLLAHARHDDRLAAFDDLGFDVDGRLVLFGRLSRLQFARCYVAICPWWMLRERRTGNE